MWHFLLFQLIFEKKRLIVLLADMYAQQDLSLCMPVIIQLNITCLFSRQQYVSSRADSVSAHLGRMLYHGAVHVPHR